MYLFELCTIEKKFRYSVCTVCVCMCTHVCFCVCQYVNTASQPARGRQTVQQQPTCCHSCCYSVKLLCVCVCVYVPVYAFVWTWKYAVCISVCICTLWAVCIFSIITTRALKLKIYPHILCVYVLSRECLD